MDSVTIGKGDNAITVDLKQPSSPSAVYDCISGPGWRSHCAALGLCWVEPARPHGRNQTPEALAEWRRHRKPVRSYSADVVSYGGQVFDELVKRGYSPSQVHRAAVDCYNQLASHFLDLEGDDEPDDEAEVSEREGNSEAPPA